MSALDLEVGDEEAAEAVSSRAARRAARRAAAADDTKKSTTTRKRQEGGSDSNLLGRLDDALKRIAEQLRARGDDELGDAIDEDSSKLAQGFVSITRHVPFLRMPLVVIVDLLEPVLAFFRVGRILVNRWFERRQRRWDEAQAAEQAAEQGAEFVPTPYAEVS